MRTVRLDENLVVVPEWIAAVEVQHVPFAAQMVVEPYWRVTVTLAMGQQLPLRSFRYRDERSGDSLGPRTTLSAAEAEERARRLATRIEAAVEEAT